MVKPRDITGEKFGRLTAIELDQERTATNKRYWFFDCECGKRVSLLQRNVTNGNTSSCGCLKLREDLTGKQFTRLRVLEQVGQCKSGDSLWRCLCVCGNEKIVAGGHLLAKKEPTRSCGCWARDQLIEKSTTHGMTNTTEFKLWSAIKARCRPDGLYGKRGIFIDQGWAESFEAFYQDLIETIGLRPSSKHQLDRIAGGTSPYQKGNVRWVLSKDNCRNKTNNRLFEYDGKTKCLSEWAEIHGINKSTLESRLDMGWTIHDALTKPLKTKPANGIPKEQKEPEYQLWIGIRTRCKNTFKYRDRGIKVCLEWENSYEAFRDYILNTIGTRPTSEHQLDRIAGGSSPYAPGNVRWATPKENTRNMTTNRLITYNGNTKCLSAWAEDIGIKPATLRARLNNGWSIEHALTQPLRNW